MILLVSGVSLWVISLCQVNRSCSCIDWFLFGSCLVLLSRVYFIYKNKIPSILFSRFPVLSSFSLPFLASLNLFDSILS